MSRPSRHVLPLILAAACWGLGTVLTKRAVAELPATALLPIQLAASVAALFGLAALSGMTARSGRVRLRVALLGVLNPGLAYLLSLAGLTTIPVSLSVLLWALEPIVILLLARIVLSERIRPLTAVLSVLAVTGAALAGSAGAGGAHLTGVAMTLAGVGCCAVYTIVAGRWIRTESTLAVVAAQQVCALVFALIVLGTDARDGLTAGLSNVSLAAWASAVASGIVYYGLAFWAFLTGLRHVTAGTAAIFLNLVAVFGVAGGHVFLSERMQPAQLAGAGLVVVTAAVLVRLKVAAPQAVRGARR